MSDRARPARVAPAYLTLFASVYALQGVVVAYFFNYNQIYMQAAGVPAPTVGWAQSLAMLPLALKFLAGPLSDRVNVFGLGHRLPYIAIGLLLETAGLIGLTLFHPGRHLSGFVACAVLAVIGLSLYDTCCDGMILDMTPPPDRPRVQGTVVAVRFLATMICSFGFGHWLARTGNGPGRGDGVLWTCAGLGVVPLAMALGLREPKRAVDGEPFRWSAFGILIRYWSLMLLGLGALYSTVAFGVEINLSPFYHSRQFDAGDIGNFAALRYLGRALGAASVPIALSRIGRYRVLWGGVLALSLTTLGQAIVTERWSAAILGFAFGFANGWDDALFCLLAMEASDPRLAASTYALIMAVANLGSLGGGLFASAVSLFRGQYTPVFVGAAVIAACALIFVPTLSRHASGTESYDERDP
jgi:PAT family beta-lactamase induction signal transducer AmpG